MKRIKKIIRFVKSKNELPLQALSKTGGNGFGQLTDAEVKKRMKRINADFRHAFKLLKKYRDTVSFFGSSRLPSTSPYYKEARELARKLVEELDVTVVSGAGPGIMQAANQGARDAKADTVGFAIELPHEQETNRYVTDSAGFYYFFSRKVALTFTARAYIFFPGGFGTLDELFEILTLKETGKIPQLPVILVGSDYWTPLLKFLEDVVYGKAKTIEKSGMSLYTLMDDHDEVVKIVAKGK
jgi:uncharacterized protein (TIGR00730 family)